MLDNNILLHARGLWTEESKERVRKAHAAGMTVEEMFGELLKKNKNQNGNKHNNNKKAGAASPAIGVVGNRVAPNRTVVIKKKKKSSGGGSSSSSTAGGKYAKYKGWSKEEKEKHAEEKKKAKQAAKKKASGSGGSKKKSSKDSSKKKSSKDSSKKNKARNSNNTVATARMSSKASMSLPNSTKELWDYAQKNLPKGSVSNADLLGMLAVEKGQISEFHLSSGKIYRKDKTEEESVANEAKRILDKLDAQMVPKAESGEIEEYIDKDGKVHKKK